MKTYILSLALFCLAITTNAQIVGNGTQKTKTVALENLTEIDIQLNGDIILDYDQTEGMTITTDANVLDYIGIDFNNGRLTLDQIKWIEPTILPQIKIGSPMLASIYQGTHSTTTVQNINAEKLSMEGNVGKVVASGIVTNLELISTGTDFDLAKLQIVNAKVAIDDDSKVILDQVESLSTDLDEDARLVLLSEVDVKNGNEYAVRTATANSNKVNKDIKFMDLKIKNNSWRRNHFVVVGPKPNGRNFSYGFSMLPHGVKKHTWTNGTKVYKEKRDGRRELLVVIGLEDGGGTISLF